MRRRAILLVAIAGIVPLTAVAGEPGVFTGLDIFGGVASGASYTTDGGAPFAGGGVVDNVSFGTLLGVGGHVGYRFDGPVSVFVSYRHIRSDIAWDATFPLFGVSSRFNGSAVSDALLANLAYELALSESTAVNVSAGAGVALNTLSGIVETDGSTGLFLADLADIAIFSPTAQIGAGVRHKIGENATLSLGASFAYGGGFETGTTRSGNLGVTDINPYGIDDVWHAGLNASFSVRF